MVDLWHHSEYAIDKYIKLPSPLPPELVERYHNEFQVRQRDKLFHPIPSSFCPVITNRLLYYGKRLLCRFVLH